MPGLPAAPLVTTFQGPLRTINFSVDRTQIDAPIGFNVRGGSEFGLGIFVSQVTQGSIADCAGFMVGDQILSINGRKFENISHKEAIDFIVSQTSLSVVVMATGKIPDEETPAGKHTWIAADGSGGKIIVDANIPAVGANGSGSADVACVECVAENDTPAVGATIPPVDYPVTPPPQQQQPAAPTIQAPAPTLNGYSTTPVYINGTIDENGTVTSKGSKKSKKGSLKSRKKNSVKSSKGSVRSNGKKDTLRRNREQLVTDVDAKLEENFEGEELELLRTAIDLYHRGEAVENLLNRIIVLFPPQKFHLLRTVRCIVFADEVVKYDKLVNTYLTRKKRMSTLGRRAQVNDIPLP